MLQNGTTIDYDEARKTYPRWKTLPPTGGSTVTHVYEYWWDDRGRLEWEKDENLNETTYDYDVFGRLVEVNYPDGGQVSTEYQDEVFPRHVITSVKENGSTFRDKHDYFDGLGRSIETITSGVDGETVRPVVTQQFYDEMGRNYLTRGPFFGTDYVYEQTRPTAHPWVEKFFYYRGRPTQVDTPDTAYGTISPTFSYSGLSTTVTDPDQRSKTEKKDYLGRLIEVKEHAGGQDYTTTYTYNAAGDLRQVTDHAANTTNINYDTLGRKLNMTDPDMGYWQYTYDANGNLLTQTDAKGQVITFAYDQLNRVTSKTYSTGDAPVSYAYDTANPNGKRRIYSVTKGNASTYFLEYDSMGRVKKKRRTLDGSNYDTGSVYDLSGRPTQMIYPNSYYVDYSYYPGSGLLDTVTGSDSVQFAKLSLYEATGKIGQVEHANETATRNSYNPYSGRLLSIVTEDPSGQPQNDLQRKAYGYTAAGDVHTTSDELRGIAYTYSYDYLHRLLTETNTGGQDAITYQYSPIGNITSRQVGSSTFTYAYDTAKKHAVKTINLNGNNYTFDYDANGNMTTGFDFADPANVGTRTVTYNADNLPSQIQYTKGSTVTTNFVYDGDGVRTKKSVQGGSTTLYVSEQYEVIGGVPTLYVFAGNLRVAKVDGAEKHYFHKDHLGSSATVSDEAGAGVETTSYMPFGPVREQSGSPISNYKYIDQELDPESGVYNYKARLYDPVIGRFLSPDGILPMLYLYDPQLLNGYTYCLNNPLIYVDRDGKTPATAIGGGIMGGIAGGIAGGITGGIASAGDKGGSDHGGRGDAAGGGCASFGGSLGGDTGGYNW